MEREVELKEDKKNSKGKTAEQEKEMKRET